MIKTRRKNRTAEGFAGRVNSKAIDQLADKITAMMTHPAFGGLVVLLTLVTIGTVFWQLMLAAK